MSLTLKMLSIKFQSVDEIFTDVNSAIKTGKVNKQDVNTLIFDSIKTFRQFMTLQKLEILTAISRSKPDSIYQLAKQLDRQPHHVLKDCRSLESHGFIKMIESGRNKGQVRPELIYDYDVIHVMGNSETFHPVSTKCCEILDKMAIA